MVHTYANGFEEYQPKINRTVIKVVCEVSGCACQTINSSIIFHISTVLFSVEIKILLCSSYLCGLAVQGVSSLKHPTQQAHGIGVEE